MKIRTASAAMALVIPLSAALAVQAVVQDTSGTKTTVVGDTKAPSTAVTNPPVTSTTQATKTTHTQHGKPAAAAKPKPAKPVWTEFKLNPKSTMFLDFTDTNPDTVFSLFSRTSGITIVKDPSFKSTLTVTSAKAVKLSEAFAILNTVLGFSGYELQKQENMLVVTKKAPPAPPVVAQVAPPVQPTPAPTEEKVVLKIYHLQNASASAVAKVVNEVFTQQSLEAMIQQLQQGGGGMMMNPGMPMGMPGRPGANQAKTVRASSDDYSNAVVVNAPEKYQKDVENLINDLDKSTDQPLLSEVFKLEHVNVDDVVSAIQDVLTANSPTGRGAAKSDNNNNMYMGYYSYVSSRSKSSGGQSAVAVKPTNSVIVNATKANMELVRKLIESIDKVPEFVGTTYVLHLDNAKASDVATLLNNAFTKRRDQSDYLDSFFVFYSDDYGGGSNRKSDIVKDIDDDGNLVNVRDLTGKVNITADPNTNSLIIVTIPSNIKLIKKVVDQIDQISAQVMIETIIVEANLDKTTKLGVEWSFLNKAGNLSHSGGTNFNVKSSDTTTPLTGLKYTLTGPDYSAFVNAMANDTRFKVLSTPRIFTSNNVKAEINVAQQVPYITSQLGSTGTSGSTNSNLISNYDFKNVGVVLTVTPRITAKGEVSMDVVQSADDLQGYTDYNAPIINHRQASTTATVADGETIVLGGIIRNTTNVSQTKVPILGDLPLIGPLFRSSSHEQKQTELVVLLTPHIVRNAEEARQLREAEEKRLSKASQDAIKAMAGPKVKK